jgi:hypothetical protein
VYNGMADRQRWLHTYIILSPDSAMRTSLRPNRGIIPVHPFDIFAPGLRPPLDSPGQRKTLHACVADTGEVVG